MSGENEFVLKINPKDKSSGASSETYTIKVKKTSSSSGNNVGTGSSNKDDVPSNPQTSDVPAMLMALVLMFSLIASITLYKKNLKGYN